MKAIATIIFLMFVCLIGGTAVSAQKKDPIVKKIYKNIQVEKFTVKQGVEFPAENTDKIAQNMVRALIKSKRFTQVTMAGDQTAITTTAATPTTSDADVPTLRLSGEIILYNKGNQGGRYILGPFGGQKFATRVVATVKFIDVKTGEVVLEQSADGIVSGGFFGGGKGGANDGLSDEVVKIVKNNFSEKAK